MLRIVGVQRSERPEREFILLQNQGGMRVVLRGHLVMADRAPEAGLARFAHAFSEEESIQPGLYVCLFSGAGMPRWVRAKDGSSVFYCYMGRDEAVWDPLEGGLHVLHTQHTYCERGPALLLR
jgi:hypothetical protein